MNKKFLSVFGVLLVVSFVALATQTFAFTENNSAPPTNNVPLPLNVSGTTQVKSGALLSNSSIHADIFYDRYNTAYYLNANATSRLNAITINSLYSTGNGNVNDLYVRARGRWISQLGRSYIQSYGAFVEPGYLYCAPGYTLMGVGGHPPQADRIMTWRHTGNRGISMCTGSGCNGEVVNSAWVSCISE